MMTASTLEETVTIDEMQEVPIDLEFPRATTSVGRADLLNHFTHAKIREGFAFESFYYAIIPVCVRDYGKLGLAERLSSNLTAITAHAVPQQTSLELYLPNWAVIDPLRMRPILPFYGAKHQMHVGLYDCAELSLCLAIELRDLVFKNEPEASGGIVLGTAARTKTEFSFWVDPDGKQAAHILVYGSDLIKNEHDHAMMYAAKHGYRVIELKDFEAFCVLIPFMDAANQLKISELNLRESLCTTLRASAQKADVILQANYV